VLQLDSGLITTLHTFGKDMKFNPHLHIITNSKINFNSKFNTLWRKVILRNLNIKSNKYYYGYYLWSNNKISNKQIAKYISRYIRHPPISSSRITSYNDKVTFKSENKQITKSINNFISSLIQHIPPKNFKMIRHYGAYSGAQKCIFIKFM
jgi:hypothetical protein